jgi:hypothetical protein
MLCWTIKGKSSTRNLRVEVRARRVLESHDEGKGSLSMMDPAARKKERRIWFVAS